MYWVLSAGAEMIISPRNMNLRDKALLLAAEDGQLEVLQYLINEGGNVNVQDFDREGSEHETPLMLAANGDHVRCMEALIQAGADVNAIDWNQRTTLVREAEKGNLTTVEVMIKSRSQCECSRCMLPQCADGRSLPGSTLDAWICLSMQEPK